MLDIHNLLLLKEQYSGHKIIYVRFADLEYVFRSISLKEYREITSIYKDEYQQEDAICDVACIYPEDIVEFAYCGHAGIVTNMSQLILKHSGVTDPLYAMDVYSIYKSQDTLEMQCMDMIKAFIKDYSYEEMEDWTYDKLMYMTVKAERVAKLQGFDWHLEDTRDKYKEEFDKINIENEEFNISLLKNGLDPMMFYKDSFESEIKDQMDKALPEEPVISGNDWQNEEMLNAIREQINKKKLR